MLYMLIIMEWKKLELGMARDGAKTVFIFPDSNLNPQIIFISPQTSTELEN